MDEIILKEENGQILASSLDVSKKFNKRHDSVLRDIDNILKSDSTILWSELFKETTYVNSRGKTYRCFDMNRDGFSLLAMGFTGKEALTWKLKYIEAFNRMEESLKLGTQLTEEEKLKLQLFSKDASEVAYAHKRLVELATAPYIEKAEFHDAIATAENSVSFGDFAGSFQNTHRSFGRNKIIKWCRQQGYLCSSYDLKNKPSQQMLESGYMQYEENTNERNGSIYITYKPLLTGKGQIWLTKKLNEYLK